MFSSRLSGLARESGHQLEVVGTLEAALDKAPGADLVLVDLNQLGGDVAASIRRLRQASPTARLIAYGPHVAEATLQEARKAGCDEVWPRSQFDRQTQRLFRGEAAG